MEEVARRSARAVLVDDEGRVLLLRAVLPDEEWWEPPGGGIEPDEGAAGAALRELREETGVALATFDDELGFVDTTFVWNERRYRQREHLFLARTDVTQISLPPPDPAPSAKHVEYRWWSMGDLSTTNEQIHPPQLAELLRQSREVESGA